MRKMVVFGAYAAIAQAALRRFADDADDFVLVGRDLKKLEAVKADLAARGAGRIDLLEADLAAIAEHARLFVHIKELMPEYDHAFIAYGSLGDQRACIAGYQAAEEALRVNFLSVVSLLTVIANDFEARRGGTIAVITSVAGDRGRQSNYVYGAAKGALSIFLQGLRNRLAPAGVRVLTIKPGFVDTPMTAGIKKGPLFAAPEAVGRGIYRAVVKGRNVVYLPWFWALIMTAVRLIPECCFKRMRL